MSSNHVQVIKNIFKFPDDWNNNEKSTHTSNKKNAGVIEENNEDSSAGRYVRIQPNNTIKIKEKGINKKNKRNVDEITDITDEQTMLKKPKRLEKTQQNKINKVSNEKKAKMIKNNVSQKADIKEVKNKFIDNLKGSRFRFINEQLYKCESSNALTILTEDPTTFTAYHEGFRHQVQQWPFNPLNRIIKSIQKLPKQYVIADFGCGDAQLGKTLKNTVYSLDLIAGSEGVIACDMANTPLKSESIDVAVYCLSLMGTNLRDFFLEANRVLSANGIIKIAEIVSRFDNLYHFIKNVEQCGFKLLNKDIAEELFYFMDFKKVANIDKANNTINSFSLKPCIYKKR